MEKSGKETQGDMKEQSVNEMTEMEIDLLDLLRLLWNKLWIIILSMIICGAIGFASSVFIIPPKYTASAMMYVNNNALAVGNSQITFSSSQLSAAKSLLDVYVVILESRTTLEEVIEKAELDYTYSELCNIVSSGSVDNTEIFNITATCTEPETAELIVDTLVDILPARISEIVEGSSVRVVDEATVPVTRSSPSYTRYAIIGILVGAVMSGLAIVVEELLNTSVRDEEYLKNRYNIPVLALIPNANEESKKGYGYKYSYKYGYKQKYGYGYQKYGYYRSGYEKSYGKTQGDGDNK